MLKITKAQLAKIKKMTPAEAFHWLRSIGELPPKLSPVHMNVVQALRSVKNG